MKTVLTLLFLLSSVSFAQKKSFMIPPKDYSLEDLDSAANILTLAEDSNGSNASVTCGIPANEAKDLSTPLRDIIAEKIKAIKSPKRSWKTCKNDCHCSVYETVLEDLEKKSPLADSQKKLFSSIEQEQKPTNDQKITCAEKSQWFCKSPLLNRLRNVSSANKTNSTQ